MLKKMKSVSMLLALAGISSTGAAYAVAVPEVDETRSVQQQSTCTGVVKDATGETVIGASVVVKGTTNGTITGLDGDFSLSGVKKGDIIQISFVGYKTQEIVWNGQNLEITLKDDSQILDEVVVVGYGTQKKVNVTGAVSMVDSEVLASRPVSNVSQALQGQIPGLNMSVSSSGGSLDATMNFNIRGTGTLGSGSSASPLVLIDGVEGDMNTLNPNDIENISVLKDASSSSIYGARAAFGVILITTKNGKAGKTRVNYSGNVRFNDGIGIPKMANSYDFATMFNAANVNDGNAPIFNDAYMQNIKDYMEGKLTQSTVANGNVWAKWNEGAYDNVDWFKEFYKSWVPSQEHNLSVSGGNEKTQYVLSGNFLGQNGLLRHGEDYMNRYTLNGKITTQLASWARLTYTTRWTREDYGRPSYMSGLFFHNVARKWPIQPAYDPNGFPMNESEIEQMENGGLQTKNKDFYTNQLAVVFEPIKDWHINLEGTIRSQSDFEHWDVLPVYYWDVNGNQQPMAWGMGDGTYSPGQSRVNEYGYKESYYATNIYTDYSKTFKSGHYFKVLLGFNAEKYSTRSITGQRDGLISPEVPTLNTAVDADIATGGYAHNAVAGFFGRINYAYKDRYMAEINGRYDGSSRFVGDKRWGFFPSFSLGWNIAREGFFEKFGEKSTISTLKLRASWGQLGNTNTDDWYPFYQSMPVGTNYSWIVNGSLPSYSSNPGLVSSLMTWETIQSWDLGLDFALLNNRLTGSVGYFVRKTLDMVGPAPELPVILGAAVPKVNNADMQSVGWELDLGWQDRIKDFSYNVHFLLSDDRQKILKYPNPTGNLSTWNAEHYVGEIWGLTTIGIAKTDAEMNEHLASLPNGGQDAIGTKWAAGDIMYKDVNGDGRITEGKTLSDLGDLTIIGNNSPRYRFGLDMNASWKGFDVRIFLQGVMKRDAWLSDNMFWGANGGMWQASCFTSHLDYFRPEGDPEGANLDAYFPRPLSNNYAKNQKTQTGYLQNAAYMRLKNFQIGYTLPNRWTQKAGMSNVRIFFSGENLFTVTGLPDGFDPETINTGYGATWGVQSGKSYPLSRTFSTGISVNF